MSERPVIFDNNLHELVNSSNGIFKSIQELVQSVHDQDFRTDLVDFSIQYRSTIRNVSNNLQTSLANELNPIERKHLTNLTALFYSIECVWHLAEIFYVDVAADDVLLPKFQQWIRFHFPKFEKNAIRYLQMDFDEIESNSFLDDYWRTIMGALMQGHIDLACSLLDLHSDRNSFAFRTAIEILRTMPIYKISSTNSFNDFNIRWKTWSLDCQSKIATKMFVNEPEIELLMRLVIGEENAFERACICCETWYEMLAGWLFFNHQVVKYYEIGKSASRFLTKFESSLKNLDFLIFAVIEGDICKLISNIGEMSESGWFATHIVDLLYHSGYLKNLDTKTSTTSLELRDKLLLEYGTLLFEHKSYWQLGLSYLDDVNNRNLARSRTEVLLSHKDFDSETDITRILYEAKKRNLNTYSIKTIPKIYALRAIRRQKMGEALVWSLKSEDGPLISQVADRILKAYSQNGHIDAQDLLMNLGSAILCSDRLIFLSKYCEFQQSLKTADKPQESARILTDLMLSKITPKYFWKDLFKDVCSLLENNHLPFTSESIYEIIKCFNSNLDHMDLTMDKERAIRNAFADYLTEINIYELSV